MSRARAVRRRITTLVILLCGSVAACRDNDETALPPPAAAPDQTAGSDIDVRSVTFDTATILLRSDTRTVPMHVEIAERPDQRAVGLMDRDELDADAGMIFLYDVQQGRDSGFWMYRTRIPLDIAYFDGAGRILAIRQMMPCTSFDAAQCPGYSAGVDYYGAIEANRGFFTRHDIGVGDRVVLPGRIGE